MKLVFIKKNFSVHGGAENYMRTLLGRLSGKADIHVIAGNWTESQGITFHKINPLSSGSFMSTVSFNSMVCRRLKSIKADCVISFERTTCQDIYRAGDGCHKEWLRIRGMAEPAWKRLSFLVNPLHLALLRMEKKIFSETPLIIANSNMVKSHIIRHYGSPGEKIKVIYNGVDIKRFSPQNAVRHRDRVRKELHAGGNTGLILFVGSGFERKGLRTLLRAFSLMAQGNDVRLVVIGRGKTKKFKSMADSLGISDKVLFHGTTEEIEKFYAAADIFVLPTLYDPFSNAALEAMASGLPVITTRNNGASELITNGKEGFVMEDPLDSNALYEMINKALSHRNEMGTEARHKAEGFTIEKAANEIMETILSFSA